MRKVTLVIAILFMVIGMTIGFSINATAQQPPIPSWIKNTAKWWGEGQISDDEFIKAIQYLIDQKILIVTSNAGFSQTQSSVNGGTSSAGNNMNQTFKLSGISYQVTKVVTSSGNFFSKPAGTYVIVHLTIENLENTPSRVLEDQFRISDGKGRIFSPSSSYVTDKYTMIVGNDLQPDLPISGVIGFDVPFDSNLQYDLVVYSVPNNETSEKAIIKLGLGKDFS